MTTTGFLPRGFLAFSLAATLVWPVESTMAVTEDATADAEGLAGAYLAARTADVEKDVPNAARFYRTALQSDPENLYLLERAVILTAAAGEMEDALDFARKLNQAASDNHIARLILSVELIREKKHAEALESIGGDAGTGVLADLTSALLIAWARFGAGDVETALKDLTLLKGEDWYEPFKLLHGGYIALAAGKSDEAITQFDNARELDPSAVRITEAYARALAIAGRQDEAEDALKDFLTRFPDNPLALAALEEIRSGDAESGTVSTPAEGAAEALAGIGAAVGQEGGVEVALLYLRLALHLDPGIAGGLAALSLGNLLDASNQGAAAIEAFESIAPEAPFRALGALRAALSLDGMDRTEEAETAFKEAISRNPTDVQSYLSYGNMLRGRERFAEAAAIYSDALEQIPGPGPADWSIFYYRGIAYERTKQWPLAEADFKKALELSPDQPLVLNYLGYSWVDMGVNLTEAMAMIRKAVELRPNDGYIVDSLGWAHYRLGDYASAVTELERAVSLRPEDPVINDHLGDAYWQEDRPLEAQFQWRHARDFGAEQPALQLILRKIAERQLIEEEQAPAAGDEERDAFYTVKPGDSLWTISAALLKTGEAYQRLFESNKDVLQDPNMIRPGMQLRIPGES